MNKKLDGSSIFQKVLNRPKPSDPADPESVLYIDISQPKKKKEVQHPIKALNNGKIL